MDAVYPAGASALARGRRLRRREHAQHRHRTMPVTFAEIKEVDEESCGEESERGAGGTGEERRRRPDVLDEGLWRQFAEFRRRRARGQRDLRELSPAAEAPAVRPARTASEPDSLHLQREPEAGPDRERSTPLLDCDEMRSNDT